jgi:serine/threonine protein kinase
MSIESGQILDDKYRIVRVIGVGGMGTVYEGEHTLIRRRIAIKVLSKDSATTDAVGRFEREAQAAGRIGSDHILEVLDVGTTADGQRYIVMEYLDGETLARRLERLGRMTAGQDALLARQILVGLAAAHDAGIVHRDLKPDNVFILREKAGLRDFVKLIDFGISKFEQSGSFKPRLTQSGAVLGTPCYMSPEQARGVSVDGRSDLHACGVILYEAITGRVPFEGQNFNEMMFQIALGERPRASAVVPLLDPRFEAIIGKAMERDMEKRYQSAREFSKELEAWMRANSLSTTTGEIQLADVAAALLPAIEPESENQSVFDRNAPTLAEGDVDVIRPNRTVTNASMDTVVLPGRHRWRGWRIAGVGTGVALAIAGAAFVFRSTRAPAMGASALSPPSASTTSELVASARASATPASSTFPATMAPSASQDTASAAGAHSSDPRRKPKPPKGGKPTGKQVDFGY